MAAIAQETIDAFVQAVLRLRSEYEFSTFWLGARITGEVTQEEALALKREINRRVGERVEAIAPGLVATLDSPVARINLLYPGGGAALRLAPLLIYGRYLKLSREIPQSKWPCRWCHGSGCERCGGTGKVFQRSVEELVAAPILAVCRATGTKLHTVGREDVDARMLGRGRPFVLELALPRLRRFDLAPIQEEINRLYPNEVGVRELQFGDKALRERLTQMAPDKTYRAAVNCLAAAQRPAVEGLASLRDVALTQETPRRVLHRRSNLVRRRTVRDCSVELTGPGDPQAQRPAAGLVRRFVLTLRVQSGTYIKEFISGDEGRTRPSVSEILGVPCDCAELDVLDVHCDPLRDEE